MILFCVSTRFSCWWWLLSLEYAVRPILTLDMMMMSSSSNSFKQHRTGTSRRRGWLPSRPVPWREEQQRKKQEQQHPNVDLNNNNNKVPLDAERLMGMTRMGQASISPDGTLVVFEVKQYDFDTKKFDQQLWLAHLEAFATPVTTTTTTTNTTNNNNAATEERNAGSTSSPHLRQLTSGAQHGWTSANTPTFSPCGKYIAFLSNRKDNTKTSVWILPVGGPGEATLFKEFPVSVGDLDWSHHEAHGIIVSASVYVDVDGTTSANNKEDAIAMTAARDKVLDDPQGHLGGLNAVLFKRLPMREWDRWMDAKMMHPFFVPVVAVESKLQAEAAPGGYTIAVDTNPIDLLQGVPTAVPSGAFGGSEDWSVSPKGAVAVSAVSESRHETIPLLVRMHFPLFQ